MTKTDKPKGDWWEIYLQLKELYMSVFKWSNLPETVNARYIELSLATNGQVCFFHEEEMECFIALKSMNSKSLNIYGEPMKVRVYGMNGYNNEISVGDQFNSIDDNTTGVVVYDNKHRRTPLLRLQDYAKRIYHMEKTIDINIRQQRTPRIPIADKDTEYSLRNFFKAVDDYKDYIVIDKTMMDGNTNINMVLAPAPFVSDKIMIQKKELWNEVLSYMGILNDSAQKKERLVSDEAKLANGLAMGMRNSRLLEREIAVDRIKKIFPELKNISVEVNTDLLDEWGLTEPQENKSESGVVDNE